MKVTISVKGRWDAQDRGKTNFRLLQSITENISFLFIDLYYAYEYNDVKRNDNKKGTTVIQNGCPEIY